ncbi:terminase [Variovorax sp. WS11]|uniref:terminase large subunit n=1 Tax=Variovorax sp. WS11 TaxID=1105204 RepID=UPI000D0D5C5F|nr:terminase large subunit [Variovorax sp. WS11]NDZ12053.1 terminase large subunit [Variovorax sp. WS11]PSL83763.1 terminase [Variovorax sp. WS11]
MEWTTACVDWERRLIEGRSIIPAPIFPDQAEQALAIFKQLRVTDLPGKPTFGECSEQWVFDFVGAIFGAYDAEAGKQLIREFFLLISKKNTKSTIAAGIMLTAVILCWREEEEHLILAPTKEVADNSFKPAAGMVRADEELAALFHVQDHIRTITHRVSKASLKVVAADTDTVSGKKSGKVLVDEHWIFGSRANASGMFMEATGGQVSREEGWVIYLSTQSEEPPAGVFKEKLDYYRDVRDGKIEDKKSLGVLYEFPPAMLASKGYMLTENFYVTNPNMGRSVSKEWLEDNLKKHQAKQDGSFQKFLAKHLNVEIGLNLRSDRWAGADFWEASGESGLTLQALLKRCEVAVIGIDGGGLDDMLGVAVVGRESEATEIQVPEQNDPDTGELVAAHTVHRKRWLHWGHAWVHEIALERRKEIAPRLLDFQKERDLTIVQRPGLDVSQVVGIVCKVREAGLLPEKLGIGVDGAGITDIVDALVARDFNEDHIVAIQQGWKLNGAVKTTERKVAGGELVHGSRPLMAWCVGNARTVDNGNAISITKQASGKAKIDPVMALFDAVSLMALNPVASGRSFWETA